MKIALITDQHFGARNSDQRFSDYFRSFYDEQFFPYLEEHGIDTVIDLGDTFDSRKYVNYKSLLDSKQMWFDKLHGKGIKLHSIIGNHTIFYKNTNSVNSMRLLFEKYDNMSIYPEATEVSFDGLDMLFMPWINSENHDSSIEIINKTTAQVCMGHLELSGFEMNTTMVSPSGYSRKLFNKFDIVYSGHYHRKNDDGQVFYLGCPYQITWNDHDCPKGFHVFDTNTRELERIENPHLIFEKIYYDDNPDDFDLKAYKNKFVKLIVVNKKDLFQFDRFVEKLLNEVNTHDVKIIENFDDIAVDDNAIENVSDTLTLLNDYVEEMSIDIDKDKLGTMLKTLYAEASDIE